MDISQFLNFKDRWQLEKNVFTWLICGLFLLLVINTPGLLDIKLPDNIRFIYFPEVLIPAFFLVLILLFVLCKDFFNWIKIQYCVTKNRFKSNGIYEYVKDNSPNKWIFNGGIKFEPASLVISSSRAGCLLTGYYWKDFLMSFDMEFSPTKTQTENRLGIIFRAEDLDNYFMIEISSSVEEYGEKKKDESGKEYRDKIPLSVKLHVRYKGGWEGFAVDEIEGYAIQTTFKITFKVEGENVELYFGDKKKRKPDFNWLLPNFVDVNHFETGVREDLKGYKNNALFTSDHVKEISFRLGYGLAGFRSHWNHSPTVIRNLKIEPLIS